MPRTLEWKIAAGFTLALLLSSGVGFYSYRAVERLRTSAGAVTASHALLTTLESLEASTVDSETGQRGYTITGDSTFLEPYHESRRETPRLLQTLVAMTGGDTVQRARVAELTRLAQRRLDVSTDIVTMRRSTGFDAARQETRRGYGKALQDSIRAVVDAMQRHEQQRLLARETMSRSSAVAARRVIVAGGVLSIAVVAGSMWIVAVDLRRRREAETQVRTLNASLERRAVALHAANEQLQEVDRLKSEFLASMSHELRTPLNSIIGFTGVLRQGLAGALNDEQVKQLGMVQHSARHLLSLINDLLDLARVESGRMQVEVQGFQFEEVARDVLRTLEPQVTARGLEATLAIEPDLPTLFSDRRKVFQVLLNLTSNAVKFTDHGQVSISAARANDTLAVAVTDTGIGIRPEHQGLLFEAFRQVEGSARRVYEGTGLGLHLSRRLLNLLHGRIEVQSEFGHGSRFTFYLPFDYREAAS